MQRKPAKHQMEQSNEEDRPEDKPEGETMDFNSPTYVFNPNEQHEWRQRGPYIECRSCELIHAQYIGMDKLLVGLNEKGQPLFKSK